MTSRKYVCFLDWNGIASAEINSMLFSDYLHSRGIRDIISDRVGLERALNKNSAEHRMYNQILKRADIIVTTLDRVGEVDSEIKRAVPNKDIPIFYLRELGQRYGQEKFDFIVEYLEGKV